MYPGCLFYAALKKIGESVRIRTMNEKGIVKLHTLRRLDIAGSSKGDQEKYYDEDRHAYIKLPFYYEGKYWKDYMVEHLSGRLFEDDYTLGIQIVDQEIIMTDKGLPAVRSADFCADDEQWLSVARIFERFRVYPEDAKSGEERLWQIMNTAEEYCGIDLSAYLTVMFVADLLLLNEDRHYNNLGLLYTDSGSFGVAPLFDFGLGLFEHGKIYENKSLKEIEPENIRLRPLGVTGLKALDLMADLGYREDIAYVVSGIRTELKRELFPNDNGYEWYVYISDKLRKTYERKI